MVREPFLNFNLSPAEKLQLAALESDIQKMLDAKKSIFSFEPQVTQKLIRAIIARYKENGWRVDYHHVDGKHTIYLRK